MGDIGTHAENLVHYITDLEIDRLCADLSVNIPNRKLDDDGNVLVRFKGGARGIIYASQVSKIDECREQFKKELDAFAEAAGITGDCYWYQYHEWVSKQQLSGVLT